MTNPYQSPGQNAHEPRALGAIEDNRSAGKAMWLMYWNASLAIVALACYIIPFAALAIDNRKGSLGFKLFPLAALGTLTLTFCLTAGCVQAILLMHAFVVRSPTSKHRLMAISIVAGCVVGWFMAVYFGWAIRV